MKKQLFIELLKLLKKENYSVRQIQRIFGNNTNRIEALLKLTDDEVNNILKTKNEGLIETKLYFYINKDKLNSSLRDTFEKNLKEENDNLYYAFQLIGQLPDEKLEYYFNIIVNAEKKFQASCIFELLTSEEVSKNERLDKVINLILTTEENIAGAILDVANSKEFMKRDDCLELLNLFKTVKEEFQIVNLESFLEEAVRLKQPHNKILELADIMINAKTEYISYLLCECICNEAVLKHEQAIRIVRTIVDMDEEYKVKTGVNIATEEKLIKRNDLFEIFEILSKVKNVNQAESIITLLDDDDILKFDNILELLTIVSSIENKYILRNIKSAVISLATNLYSNEVMEITRRIAHINKGYQAKAISDFTDEVNTYVIDDYIRIIDFIIGTKYDWQAQSIVNLASNNDIIESSHTIELCEIIINIENETIANCAVEVATDWEVLERPDLIDIVALVASAKEDYQAECAKDLIVINGEILDREDIQEILEIIVRTDNKDKIAILDRVVNKTINHKDSLKVLKMFNEDREEFQYKYGLKALYNGILEEDKGIEVLEIIMNAKKEFQAKFAIQIIENEILMNKIVESKRLQDVIRLIVNSKNPLKAKITTDILLEEFKIPKKEKIQEFMEIPIINLNKLESREDFNALITEISQIKESEVTVTTNVKVKTINSNNTKRNTN